MLDGATIAVVVGAAGIALGQWFTMRTVNVNAVNARIAAAATAQAQADAIKEAARLQDERAERDRRWLKEDRAELARTVQATADALAMKVAADQETGAALGRSHAADLAALVRSDQAALSMKVETATTAADAAVDKLTGLILDNTKISTDAFHEANGAKEAIADVNRSLAEEVRRRNDLQDEARGPVGGRDAAVPVKVEVVNTPLATTTTTRDE